MPENTIEELIFAMNVSLNSEMELIVCASVNEFVKAFQKNAFIINGHMDAFHIAARCFASLGNKRNALENIRLYEWNGYDKYAEIKNDVYFSDLKTDPDFLSLF